MIPLKIIKCSIFSVLVCILFAVANSSSFSQPDNRKTRKIEVKGTGIDVESARKAGFRNAISQVAGVFLLAEEHLINNDFRMEIHTFSAGMIKSYREIKIDYDSGKEGLVHVTMEVAVYTDDLFQRMKDKKIIKDELNGKIFADNFKNRKELFKNSEVQMNLLLSSFPDKFISGKMIDRKDITKLKDDAVTLKNRYQINFDKKAYDSLRFYCETLLNKISAKSGIIAMSKGKEFEGGGLWSRLFGPDFKKAILFEDESNKIFHLHKMVYKKDVENPILKLIEPDHSLALIYEPTLETKEWVRWRWYQIPKFEINLNGVVVDILFVDENEGVVFKEQILLNKNACGIARFPISLEEEQQKLASGILIAPFFYDFNLYTEKIMFKMKHTIPEEAIRKVKNVLIKINKNEP